MEYTTYQKEFIDKIFSFIRTLTIKYQKQADDNETIESSRNARQYMLAYAGQDYFEFYESYSPEELIAIGITDLVLIAQYTANRDDIPIQYHNVLLTNRRANVVNNYIELNNYYRMLNGLPDYGTTALYASNGKLVTELTNKELAIYYKNEIPALLKENPKALYLNYLGYNKISIYEARITRNFYILNYKKYILEEEQTKKFLDLYYETLNYTYAVIYNEAFKDQLYYDNFMSLALVFMTLQKFIAEQFNFYISRDFFDMESIKNMFLSYGLPFFAEVPMKYQKRILKNINTLLQYKGTNKILIDIVNLFGFSNVELFRYYLLKDYKVDINGQPILDSENPANSFELKFIQAPLDDPNISSYINKQYLYKYYDEVVADDPYWGENFNADTGIDDDLKTQILNTEFNYINTKYISINTMMNMSKLIFESAYFFNMINTLEKYNLIDEIGFTSYDMKPSGEPLSLFSCITGLWYLLFKRFGYDDLIIYTPTAISTVYGFDFEKSITELRNKVNNAASVELNDGSSYSYDLNKITEALKVFDLPDSVEYRNQIVELYANNRDFALYLQNKILTTEDYQEYKALNEIYKYNMYTNAITDLYENGDNNVYSTYQDYLKVNEPEFYDFLTLNTTNMTSVIQTIDLLLVTLETYFNTNEFDEIFINLTNITGDLLKDYLRKFIVLFKAYTVEIKDINVYYLFDDKFLNTIRMLTFLQTHVKENIIEFIGRLITEELYKHSSFTLDTDGLRNLRDYIIMKYNVGRIDTLKDKILEEINWVQLYILTNNITQGSTEELSSNSRLYFQDKLEYKETLRFQSNI